MILKSIEELQHKYSVSMCGKVINNRTNRIMKTQVNPKGYEFITFTISKGKTKCFKVHRLVAKAFIKITSTLKIEVNHLDGNKLNNNAENLEWCTKLENMAHASRTGLLKHDQSTYLRDRNLKIKTDYATGNLTQRDLAKKYNLSKTLIGNILIGKR